MDNKDSIKDIWTIIQDETKRRVEAEPVLASFFHTTVLEHNSFSSAVADLIANDLGSSLKNNKISTRNVSQRQFAS